MPTRCALTVGVDRVDRDCYVTWLGELEGAEHDARAMADVARAQHFDCVETLLSEDATCGTVVSRIETAATRLGAGDFFFLTFSGHGLQLDDEEFDETREPDALDETWCLYDGQLVDDDIRHALTKFDTGVRVFVISDSCHSGTVIEFQAGDVMSDDADTRRIKRVPDDVRARLVAANRGNLDLRRRLLAESRAETRARVLLLAACADGGVTRDTPRFGAFTQALLDVWREHGFKDSYAELHAELRHRLSGTQVPGLLPRGPTPSFETERVFLP